MATTSLLDQIETYSVDGIYAITMLLDYSSQMAACHQRHTPDTYSHAEAPYGGRDDRTRLSAANS
jgi:hypothetical protein